MFYLLVSGAAVFALDLWSKSLSAQFARSPVAVAPGLRIHHTESRKRLLGHPSGRMVLLGVWLFALASAIALLRLGATQNPRLAATGMGMALGGAAGNLFDLMRTGNVVDMIDPSWWPTFNIADVAILAGLALAFWPA